MSSILQLNTINLLTCRSSSGPVVRYGVNRYSIADPSAASILYGPGTKFTKSSWYSPWSSPSQDAWSLFSDPDAKRHAFNRRQYQNMYSMSSLVHYESFVDECADLFCRRLLEMGTGDGWSKAVTVDMGHWLQCYAFDVIGLITYSKRLGFLDFGKDIGDIMQHLDDHLTYASVVGVCPRLHPVLFKIRNWLAGSRGKGRQYIVNFTQQCMAAHNAKPKVQPSDDASGDDQRKSMDLLAKFMQKHSNNPSDFTPYHVLSGCVSNMVAGSDTTSITLSAILYHVLHNPDVLKRLRAEVDQRCPHNKASPHIAFEESQDMPYLQAVIKEALRMHPATGLPLERVVPEGGVTINGIFFSPGVSSPSPAPTTDGCKVSLMTDFVLAGHRRNQHLGSAPQQGSIWR